jgi:hypothetical protein
MLREYLGLFIYPQKVQKPSAGRETIPLIYLFWLLTVQ